MKLTILLAIILIFIAGCAVQNEKLPPIEKIKGTQELILTQQDTSYLGLTPNLNEEEISFFEMNGTNCRTDNSYGNVVDASTGQYSICVYKTNSVNDSLINGSSVVVEITKFADYDALNGSYQYNSLHLFGAKGYFGENTFGDQSRFHVNSDDDYGAQFDTNPPNVRFYHLWFTKGLYMVHITSKGSVDDKEYIANIGRTILEKFE